MRAARATAATLAVALAAAVPAAAAGPGERQAASDAAGRSVVVETRIDPRAKKQRVARSFVGFSMEYPEALSKTGNAVTGINPVFLGLTRTLTEAGNGPPVLRLGGGSADDAWWNPDRRPRRPGLHVSLSPIWVDAFRSFAAQARTPLIIGLNFAHNDVGLARDVARAFLDGIPRRHIKAFEIGNEPDIYPDRILKVVDGRERFARRRGYALPQYLRELRRFTVGLRRLDRRIPLAGPGAQCVDGWCGGAAERILRAEGRRLKLLTYHSYPLHSCEDRPRISELLSPVALNRARKLGFAAFFARKRGIPVRVTESNTVACGGQKGVSDTFASALWSVDWMFALAAFGVSGVDMHGAAPLYAPFYTLYKDDQWLGAVNPLYYGMLFFARAVGDGGAVVLDTTFATRRSRPANVSVWGVVDRRGNQRVVVVNKDLRARARMRVTRRGGRRTGEVVRLTAPSVGSREGVTIAGQSFPVPTLDGRLEGRPRVHKVRPRRGVYRFSVPPASAAMLTIPRSR